MIVSLLTTVDNPHSPFDDWDAWFVWDTAAGYDTAGLLARIAKTSDDLSEQDFILAISSAIDEIVYENVSGVHTKVERDVPEPDD